MLNESTENRSVWGSFGETEGLEGLDPVGDEDEILVDGEDGDGPFSDEGDGEMDWEMVSIRDIRSK